MTRGSRGPWEGASVVKGIPSGMDRGGFGVSGSDGLGEGRSGVLSRFSFIAETDCSFLIIAFGDVPSRQSSVSCSQPA